MCDVKQATRVYCLTSFSHSQLDIASATFLSIYVDVEQEVYMYGILCFMYDIVLTSVLCMLYRSLILITWAFPSFLFQVVLCRFTKSASILDSLYIKLGHYSTTSWDPQKDDFAWGGIIMIDLK